MFIIIIGKANQGKSTVLKRLIDSSANITNCYHISPGTPYKTPLFDLMVKYLEEGYKEFFIDDLDLFTWKRTDTSATRSCKELTEDCLVGLEGMAEECKVDIFVTMQLSSEGF